MKKLSEYCRSVGVEMQHERPEQEAGVPTMQQAIFRWERVLLRFYIFA
jgi:hypothetical protein